MAVQRDPRKPGDFWSFSGSDGRSRPDVLARAVLARRNELGLSQQDVREASGLSVTTISKIERGYTDVGVQPATLRRLDAALQWQAGTAESWLEGSGGVVVHDGERPAEIPLVAQLVPQILAALDARAGVGSVTTNLSRLPAPVRRAVEDLVATLADAFDPSPP